MPGVQVLNYDFFATICGITPSKPGFAAVRIAPALGELNHVVGSMPHPSGMIKIEIQKTAEVGISADITLPDNVPGVFVWKGKSIPLRCRASANQTLIKFFLRIFEL